jgi:Domain of unknown function (DUF1833)
MRLVSGRARQAMYAPETAEVFLALIVLRYVGPPLGELILRFVNNTQNIWSRAHGEATAQEYLGCPFQIVLPEERDDQVPVVRLSIDNVDQNIVSGLRQMIAVPTLWLYVVLAATPDTIEAGPFEFALRGAEYDAVVVTGELAFHDTLNAAFPVRIFTPGEWPGVYGPGAQSEAQALSGVPEPMKRAFVRPAVPLPEPEPAA